MAILHTLAASALGVASTLLSTVVGERKTKAVYPEIMGCERGCDVVATGWPLVFVRDYPGMSVVNAADISEAIFAADRFDGLPFAADFVLWSALWLLAIGVLRARSPAL